MNIGPARPRTVFLGTPGVAVPTLDRLTTFADVALVITQPDRPVGRSGKPQPSPVKRVAEMLGIEVVQPQRSTETAMLLERRGSFDVAVLVAFGQLIRPEALGVPSAGFLNVHFSLLPRWRGAAPVQRALMTGDDRVGVSVMRLDEGLDTGPVIAARSTAVGPKEVAGDVFDRLAGDGAELVCSVLGAYVSGLVVPVRQPEAGITHAAKITPDDRIIDWSDPAVSIVNRIRGLSPRPAAQGWLGGSPVKILRAEATTGRSPVGAIDDRGVVGTGSGRVRLVSVQPAGKQVMAADDWLRGLRAGALRFDLPTP